MKLLKVHSYCDCQIRKFHLCKNPCLWRSTLFRDGDQPPQVNTDIISGNLGLISFHEIVLSQEIARCQSYSKYFDDGEVGY